MNKKGFTLVELIAVVVIMAIIALIATPNIISMLDNGKKEDFVSNAQEVISKATYMYKLDKYNDLFTGDGEVKNKILLKNIKDIGEIKDPFGGTYDLENSFVFFPMVTNNGIIERIPSIYIISCDENSKCHYIGTAANPVEKNKIDTSSVKQSDGEG